MKTVYKYPLEITDEQAVLLPSDYKVLTVQSQGDQLCLWAEVDTMTKLVRRAVRVIGTGNPLPDDNGVYSYVGTAQMQRVGKTFVWHVYMFYLGEG